MTKKNINFEVLSISKSNKAGFVKLAVRFNNSKKIYNCIRKVYKTAGTNSTLVDGCRIFFSDDFEVEDIVEEYDTKGIKKLSTVEQSKVSDKIKVEIEEKCIKVEKKEEQKKVEKKETKAEESKKEVHHEKYDEIKTCLECGIPVYLAGPAGSGKNHTVEQIANEMGWNFYFSNSVQQEYKLTGFIDAGGCFHETEFYKACTDENDCIFFLDEMDASIPEVLVLLNAAIANGYFEFPNGRVDFNHVHFVAAGNTVGSGADDMYTGRMVLDQATLDRFAIIEFDYSLNVELAITNNNNELVAFVRALRGEAERKGIRATFSYRCLTMVTKLESKGMKLDTIIKIAVMKGLDKDTINTFNVPMKDKYSVALREVQKVA